MLGKACTDNGKTKEYENSCGNEKGRKYKIMYCDS